MKDLSSKNFNVEDFKSKGLGGYEEDEESLDNSANLNQL